MRQEAVFIRGASGSGKSTLAREWVKEGFIHCEPDNFKNTDTYYTHAQASHKDARSFCWEKFMDALSAGRSVVVCSTFVRKREILPYIERCKQLGIPYRIIRCDRRFKNIHNVPEARIQAQLKLMEPVEGETILK